MYKNVSEVAQRIPTFVLGIAHPETAWKRLLLYVAAWTLEKVLSTISAIPWLAKSFDHTIQEDFALPQYPIFDDESSQSVTFHKESAGDN
jgi:hypothetical protein